MRFWTILAVAVFAPCATARAAEYGPTDHHGDNFTLADGDILWGEHTNVGRFVVPAGVTAKVKPVDRETSTSPRLYGWVEVHALSIEIDGRLDASGAGYTGGGGGLGGGQTRTSPGDGAYPDDVGTRFTGGRSHSIPSSNLEFGGKGGPGDGPWGGDGDGGYLARGTNGDESGYPSVQIGSGGAGGDGRTVPSPQVGSSGGGGGRGGGAISLFASSRLLLAGSIAANGKLGNNAQPYWDDRYPNDAFGGDTSPGRQGAPYPPLQVGSDAEHSDYYGYAGAGGGILLHAPKLTIAPGAAISNLGGRNQESNGGTVKLFARLLSARAAASIRTGRLLKAALPVVGFGPTDHKGADFVLADGDVLWGEHTNVGRFVVPEGVTAKVKPMDRDSSTSPRLYGYVNIQADWVEIAGTLDASGSGYTGGGGGGGSGEIWIWSPREGSGDYEDDEGTFFSGSWAGGNCCPPLFWVAVGSPGDGPWAAREGDGGYRGWGKNGDQTRDRGIDIGSGGSGGTSGAIGVLPLANRRRGSWRRSHSPDRNRAPDTERQSPRKRALGPEWVPHVRGQLSRAVGWFLAVVPTRLGTDSLPGQRLS